MSWEQRQRERLARWTAKREQADAQQQQQAEAFRQLWRLPAFQQWLEWEDRQHDPRLFLTIDPAQPGWEAQFIALRQNILAYAQNRQRLLALIGQSASAEQSAGGPHGPM